LWKKSSSAQRTAIGAPRSSSPWSGREGVRLRGITPECLRQIDLTDVAWEARIAEARAGENSAQNKNMASNYWVDLSQSSARKPWRNKLCNFRANGHLYSFERDTCITGEDELRLLGWPRGHLVGVPPVDLLELAGHSGSVPLATVVMAGIVYNPYGAWNSGVPT